MYLKQLDLQGFKSFPEKIKLEFNEGVTAVVGPNGSGKSNISDAIRWVLGEQRAKNLRGDKMEDVIFMGTSNRRPLSFAEVSITIDNRDQKLPIDYTDVKITRRVNRSGESEYSINGTGTRLKDIQELFMDTGIGKEGYSIISQGRIDQILSSKGEERRKLFEEATGIGKHKTRRHEALNKLEKEQQNLLRVKDIISELETQVEPLEEQSIKARQYLDLKESLKEVEIITFIKDLESLSNQEEDLKEEKSIRNKEISAVLKEIERNKESINVKKEKIRNLEESIQKLNTDITEFSSEHEKKKGEIHLTIEQKNNEEKNKIRLLEEIENKKEVLEETKDEKRVIESRIMALNLEKSNIENSLREKQETFNQLDEKLSNKESNSENTKNEINQQINKSTELKGEVTKNEALKEQLDIRKNQVAKNIENFETKIHEQETHIKALKKQRTEKNDVLFKVKNEVKDLEVKYYQLEIDKSNHNETLSKEENNIIDFTSRISVLEDMEQAKDGFNHSIKTLLSMEDKAEKGICGAVGELFQPKEKYENALETALGNAIQNVVVETEEDAKNSIKYLKQNKLGRATFLPITAIKGKVIDKNDDILKEDGVFGLGHNFINFDEKYKEIALSLLGRTVIIKDLDVGVLLSKKYKHKYRMVTLDGDMFNVGGAISGGSAQKRNTHILGRMSEITNLKQQLKEKEEKVLNLKNKDDIFKNGLDQLKQNQEIKQSDVQKLEMELFQLKQEIEKCTYEVSNWENEINTSKSELSNINTQFENIDKDILMSTQAISNIQESMEEMQQQLTENADLLYNEKEMYKILGEEITEIKITLSTNKEKINNTIEDKKRLEKDLLTIEEEIEKIEITIKNLLDVDTEKTEQQKILEKEEEELRLKVEELELNLQNAIEEKNNSTDMIEKDEKSLEEMRAEHNKTEQELLRLETGFEKLYENKTRIISTLWEEYELTPREAMEQWERRLEISHEQSAKDLRNQIKALGEVNVSAIEMYKEVKERYTILIEQRKDILDSEQKLFKLIDELTTLMEEQFREQFAVISENFSEVFKELFGSGGLGYLKLADEGDILEASIDIVAQPPGKKLQNMQLLSGGERALTAIALLFGILRMKPSPFCVLDEIEAALDDANVDRYGKYLQKFAKTTQFIVITHRKGTMENSDVLYGVTMEEKGVSKLISVDFSDHIDGVI